jgi:hypothetical protein
MNKETEETVIDSFDRIYDKAIDHSIEIVRRVWSFAPWKLIRYFQLKILRKTL